MGATIRGVTNERSAAERERAEITRSAQEASKFVFTGIHPFQIERYLDPPANTPFGLEYAFHLLGDIRSKTVVDLGCGKGENIIVLAKRGADVIGIDISADLIQFALQRITAANVRARAIVGSAYDTGLEDESVDVIFCAALIHHLDIPRVRDEMYRILRKGAFIVLAEPVRLSKFYDLARKALPIQDCLSEFEHPLTMKELDSFSGAFSRENRRSFRLPFVAISDRFSHKTKRISYKVSDWVIRTCPPFEHFATSVVVRLRKLAPPSSSLHDRRL